MFPRADGRSDTRPGPLLQGEPAGYSLGKMIDESQIDEVLASAQVADGHADSLMWNRDLTRQSDSGQVDFPRLAQVQARLQCFTLVTRGLPVVNGLAAFAWWQRWPKSARGGEWARALFQIEQLERFCQASAGTAAIAATAAQLRENLAAGRLSAVLGIEGAHALEGQVERVAQLWARGVRFMGLSHLAPNELAGTCFPLYRDRGLSPLGREVLEAMAQQGMAIDLAHASRKTTADILSGPELPTFCSHAGIASATPSWRNLDDQTIRAIADRGGVVCVIFARPFIGGATVEHLVRHIEAALQLAGEDHVGLGADYDGFVKLPRTMGDVRGVRVLARALLERGMPRTAVEKVLGRNLVRFFAERVLP